MGNSYRLVICASNRSHYWFILKFRSKNEIQILIFRPWWASGGENGCFEILFWAWISMWITSGTYLKHKAPIDMNFPFSVLPLLAVEHGKIKNWIGHNSGPGCWIDLKLVRKYYVLQGLWHDVSQMGFSFKILKLVPLEPPLGGPPKFWTPPEILYHNQEGCIQNFNFVPTAKREIFDLGRTFAAPCILDMLWELDLHIPISFQGQFITNNSDNWEFRWGMFYFSNSVIEDLLTVNHGILNNFV
jgi:hypothetical protein